MTWKTCLSTWKEKVNFKMKDVEKMIEAQAIAESNKERQALVKRFNDSWLEGEDAKAVIVEILKDQLQKAFDTDFADDDSEKLELQLSKAINDLED